jgi:hypothetical protein
MSFQECKKVLRTVNNLENVKVKILYMHQHFLESSYNIPEFVRSWKKLVKICLRLLESKKLLEIVGISQ